MPPAEIRRLRDYTRLRTDLTRERTRHWSRLEKLPEDALIKVTAVASKIGSKSAALKITTARSILVIIWHLLTDPAARYHDLGAGYHASRIDKDRKTPSDVRQLEALGFTVTLAQAA